MGVQQFLVRKTTILLILLLPVKSDPDGPKDMDFDYLNDETFNPNWIKDYDPWDEPPCPGWNPKDGCGRSPARTKTPTTTPSFRDQTTPGAASLATRPSSSGSKYECTMEEVREAACLHGGECFVVDVLDTRSAHCRCSEMWTGKRCEILEDGIFGNVLSADKVEKASIAAGIVVLVIIVTVIIVYLVVKKRKQRKERAEANGNSNGYAGKALMGSEKEAMDSEDAEKCTDV